MKDKGKTMKNHLVLVVLMSALSFSATAQDDQSGASSTVPARPCEQRDEFNEFDFWLGQWDVHLENGTYAGKNKIEKSQAGCALIENWLGAAGNPGMSINYFDVATNEWVQVWSDAGGSQINIRGGLTDKGMLLEGQISYVSNNLTAPFRALWTPLDDGRVRQFFEKSDEDSESWAPWFEGFYTRTNVEQQVSEK